MTARSGSRDESGDPATPAGLFFQIEPAWSPDGTRIAFASKREGSFDIYAMNADGSETVRLTSTREDDSHPSWSADGERIVFSRGVPGDLWVMNADGSEARAILRDPAGGYAAHVVARRHVDRVHEADAGHEHPRALAHAARRRRAAAAHLARGGQRRSGLGAGQRNGRLRDERPQRSVRRLYGGGRRRAAAAGHGDVRGLLRARLVARRRAIAYSEEGAIYAKPVGGETSPEATQLTDPAGNDSSPAWRPAPAPLTQKVPKRS